MIFLLKRSVVFPFILCSVILCINPRAFAFDKKESLALRHYIMAGIYERSGDLDDSILEYKKAARYDYRNLIIHLSLASTYIKNNDIPSAIEELNIASRVAPEAVEPHAILALLYFSQDKVDEATSEYESALTNASLLEPQNINIYKSLGAIYLQKKDFQSAEKTFKLIIDLSPQDADAHFYLANIFDEQDKRSLAIEELKKAIQFNPGHSDALNYLGYLYVEENKYLKEAEEMIKKALLIDPDNGAYIDSLGWLYFKKGKVNDAIKELKKAVSLFKDPVIFDHLGDAYYKIKDFKNAQMNWEKSLQLKPDQKNIREKIESLKKLP